MLSAARTGAAALAAAVLLAGSSLLAGSAAPALADSATPSASASPVPIPAGLYGKDDPTYDGVSRQSLSLLALHTADVVPAPQAVDWLTRQQCGDGGWPSYRADTANSCTAATEDSNATALAVQALKALGGHNTALTRAVGWLKDHQNPDGGWSYNPGGTSDAGSTGLAANALGAAGTDPAQVKRRGNSPYDALAALQLGCQAPAAQQGAFAKQPDKSGALFADDLASAQALLAAAGGSLPVSATTRKGAPAPACPATTPEQSAEAASGYLVRQLDAGKQRLTQTLPGADPAPDYAATSWAVLGLIAAGHPEQAADAADWLAGNGFGWTRGQQGVNPTATALLLLVADAAKLDPYNFGGSNLVQILADSGPSPASMPPAAASATSAQPDGTRPPGSAVTGADDDENGGFSPIWLVGLGLLAGIGGGIFISLNRKSGTRR